MGSIDKNVVVHYLVRNKERTEVTGYRAKQLSGFEKDTRGKDISLSFREVGNSYVICNQSGTPYEVAPTKEEALDLAYQLIEGIIGEWINEYDSVRVVDWANFYSEDSE